MDNYSDEDITMFVNSYQTNLVNNVVKDSKIPQYVEFLKIKQHYRNNGISEDPFFKKRNQITDEDLYTIHKLLTRLKEGKTLNQTKKTVNGMSGNMSSFCPFNENEQMVEGQFDILPQVQGAMDDYHKKMKKMQKKRVDWKKTNDYNFPHNQHFQNDRSDGRANPNAVPSNSVSGIQNKYYGDEMNSQRPNYDFEQYANMSNPQMTNTTMSLNARIDQLNNNIDNTNSSFDNYNNLNMPQMAHNKKNSYQNNNNGTYTDSRMTSQANNRYFQDINNNLATRSKGVPGQLPVEHSYDYLDKNPNQVIDTRLVGEATRQDNRGYFR